MSVVDKELFYGDTVQGLGDDRIGLAARLAHIATLANSHVTASDGTLPFSSGVVRLQLLPGVTLTDEEADEIRSRLVTSGLLVQFESGRRPYALVRDWWKYNMRPDRATRAARNPPVPREVLDKVPEFAAIYDRIPSQGDPRRHKAAGAGKSREKPGKAGRSQTTPGRAGEMRAPVPEPEPEPEADTAPVSGPSKLSSPMDAIRKFESTFKARHGRDYCTTPIDQTRLVRLWNGLSVQDRERLAKDIAAYVEDYPRATLGAFCDERVTGAEAKGAHP